MGEASSIIGVRPNFNRNAPREGSRPASRGSARGRDLGGMRGFSFRFLLLLALGLSSAATTALAAAPDAFAVAPPTLNPPVGLPFAPGGTATLTAGPHTNNVHNGACTTTTPCNALDFAPPSPGHVTAAAPGIVQSVPPSCLSNGTGLVFIRHTTGGSFNGWWTGYYHLTNIQVHTGDTVQAGTYIGNKGTATPCGGSPGPPGGHVHFFLKYAAPSCGRSCIGDPFQNKAPDVDLQDIVLGGWRVTKTGANGSAQGCMTYQPAGAHHGEVQCSPSGVVTNYGAGAGPKYPSVSAVYAAGPSEDVFWRGTNGALYEESYNNGSWHGPAQIPNSLSLGGLASAPAAVKAGGSEDIFWRGTNGALVEESYYSGSWHGPAQVPNSGGIK